MEEEGGGGVSKAKAAAVTACTGMALFYVAILYAPTLILRLPPPSSREVFLIRRFTCALISSVVSVLVCALILSIRSSETFDLPGVYGIRTDHVWQAMVFPLSLTSLMYAGSFVLKFLSFLDMWRESLNDRKCFSFDYVINFWEKLSCSMLSTASNILAWRNYVVAPVTEELVFRACMIPLLLCGGFETITIIFMCPIFFSLAHLNHIIEYYIRENNSLIHTAMVVGLQLGYTVIFGSYATFLFIRTGHLLAPLVAHIFCNLMGLPVLFSRTKGVSVNIFRIDDRGLVSMAFVGGFLSFLWLLFPLTNPDLFNERTNNCRCWNVFCSWKPVTEI